MGEREYHKLKDYFKNISCIYIFRKCKKICTVVYRQVHLLFYLQIVEEDSLDDYIPEEDLEEEFLHPPTAEKATNTECNFCPEGARQLHRR